MPPSLGRLSSRHSRRAQSYDGVLPVLFDDDLLAAITEQSNLFAIQKNANKALCLTWSEMEQFLSTTMYMSVYSLPREHMYWSHKTRVEKVAEVMSRERRQTVKNSLHLNGNNLLEANAGKDRLLKIRPLIDNLLPKFQSLQKSQMLVVDERMVPFKGRSSLKQYVSTKPHKAVVSSWLLYRRDSGALAIPKKEQLNLLSFKISVASCLSAQNKDMIKKMGSPSLSVEAEREKKKKNTRTTSSYS
ncbi:hypothetical protein HPB48_014700 [Haemaphysalis longicornis]|uniref:PiggyBac transposable element-derived protein domain-containing protein n=1 Tax=Haemaphysalis longicornis TaxID=44386 RepID=A0A9J6GJF7_HAELO|nr:hypothetical protein HPB48_014700 [Haemaphysalis longicornis]